jgi:hypothetical protein
VTLSVDHGGQNHRLICKRHDFHVQIVIDVIFMPFERHQCVEKHWRVGSFVCKVLTPKVTI